MGPNDADGMANSVDPDQTAPLGISVRKLRIITVAKSADPDQTAVSGVPKSDPSIHFPFRPICPST